MLPTEYPEPFKRCYTINSKLKQAEATLYAKLRQSRPMKDASYPSERDREVYMLGLCAVEMAEVDALKREWEIAINEVDLVKIAESKG